MRANEILNEEISLFDVYAFFIRQIKLISIVFLIVFVVGITYSTTRPTLYKSTSNVTIGKSVSLNSNTVALLERPEEIAYKYSNNATITAIKNTDIINISSTNEDREQSIKNVKLTVEEIISNQKKYIKHKKKTSLNI